MKYMGSKSKIAKHIVPILQNAIDTNNIITYIEPFAGGCNVIDKIRCETRIAANLNRYLIELWKRVQNKDPLLDEVSRELYNDVRSNIDTDKYEDWMVGNVGFLASFNGRWFDGGYAQTGIEKTKYGPKVRNYYEEAKRNILTQAAAIQGINFRCCDYRDIIPHNAVIYCDPPYANTKQYANAKVFDYDVFWNKVREWSQDNIVFVSEENAPDDMVCVWQQEVSRTIKATDKSKAIEKLFIYTTK